MKVDKWAVPELIHVSITEQNFATVTDHSDPEAGAQVFTAQLKNASDAEKLVAELEDKDGELMYEEDSVVSRYPVFLPLRP